MSFWRKEVIQPSLDAETKLQTTEQLRWIEREPKNRPQSMEGVEEALLEMVAANETRTSAPSAPSISSIASGEQNPASSWDLVGRVANEAARLRLNGCKSAPDSSR